MSTQAVLLIAVIAIPAVFATTYNVGDSSGWNTGVDYKSWASGKTFNVGDTLLFTYGGLHGVDEVNKADYDSCSSGNAINSNSDGNTSIPLSKSGAHYFLCPTAGHCGQGMKLTVTVNAAGSSPAPSGSTSPATPSTPNASSPPRTPSSSTNSSQSGAIRQMNGVGLGALMALAPLVAFMG